MSGRRLKQTSYYCLPLLVASLLPTAAAAEEHVQDQYIIEKTLPNYSRDIDDRSFESVKYGKGLKVKGWQYREGVYFGGVKVDGEYGPGVVFDKGGYVWGFNHERIQFRLRF